MVLRKLVWTQSVTVKQCQWISLSKTLSYIVQVRLNLCKERQSYILTILSSSADRLVMLLNLTNFMRNYAP